MREYVDTIVLGLPIDNSPYDPNGTMLVRKMAALVRFLDSKAREVLAVGYPYSRVVATEWQFFFTPEQAAALELPHDCAECREGKDLAVMQLSIDDDRFIAFGTLHCEEPSITDTKDVAAHDEGPPPTP